MPFPEVKDFIRQKMTQEKQAEAIQKYIDELKKKSQILINDDMLKEEARNGEPRQARECPADPGASEHPARVRQPEGRSSAAPANPAQRPPKTEDGSQEMKRLILGLAAVVLSFVPFAVKCEVTDRIVAIVNDDIVTLGKWSDTSQWRRKAATLP